MRCPDVVDRLSPYLDGELDVPERRAIAEHLASCADCGSALARLTAVSDRLRTSLARHHAPDLLRARVRRDLDAATQNAGRDRGGVAAGPWRWVAAAAALAVFLGGGWLAVTLKTRASGDEAITREAVSHHQRSLAPNLLAGVTSNDPRQVKPWLDERLDFSPPVTDFADMGFALKGARLEDLNGHPGAALVCERDQHVVNVFVWPTTDERQEVSDARERMGFQVIRATHGGLAYCIVSDLEAAELRAFARVVAGPLNRGGSPLPGEEH